ncbi:MAG: hypothetical protein LKI25_05465 [Atopobiaceae bacterium]|nr:hypothetical protein [Atopobiaceae bacterium]MCI2173650.1 hypothetical protein [Atopobiaceae bacterium]MCI2207708.1 hypothetical protein [Atopobiaceae bacterium]
MTRDEVDGRGDRAHDGGVSSACDALTCDLIGETLDAVASRAEVLAVASVCDESGCRVTCEFADDGPEECVRAAREWVSTCAKRAADGLKGSPTSYSIVFEGAVADETGAYRDALIAEFGDAGAETAYSAFVEVSSLSDGMDLSWSDPRPAGEVHPLL